MLPTEFEFTLPKGLLDADDTVHRSGRMRLASAIDEIEVQRDVRSQQDPGYSLLIMLSRVITQLGELSDLSPQQLENLFTPDIAFLRTFYQQINEEGVPQLGVACPQCAHAFRVELSVGTGAAGAGLPGKG